MLSDLTLAELDEAFYEVQDMVAEVDASNIEEIEFNDEAAALAGKYVSAQVIGPAIQGYNSVNLRLGYPLLEIRTPQEVIDDGE